MLSATVEQELELTFALRGLPVDRDKVDRLSSELELNSLRAMSPMDLSGGQKVRLAIGLTLLVEPKVLVLNNSLEPLDYSWRKKIIAVLRQYVDRGLRIVELARSGSFYGDHVDEAVISTLDGPVHVVGASLDNVAEWGLADYSDLPPLDKEARTQRLSVNDLSFCYASGFSLTDMAFSAIAGEIIWLSGPNGAGKTTLLKLVALLLNPSRGCIRITNMSSTFLMTFPVGKKHPAIHCHVLYQFQEPDDQIYGATVREELMATAISAVGSVRVPVGQIANDLDLTRDLEHSPWSLQRSRRKMITLGSIFCASPDVALLDEPTAELDGLEKGRVARSLRNFASRGGTCVVISHDAPFMEAVASRQLTLNNGVLTSFGR